MENLRDCASASLGRTYFWFEIAICSVITFPFSQVLRQAFLWRQSLHRSNLEASLVFRMTQSEILRSYNKPSSDGGVHIGQILEVSLMFPTGIRPNSQLFLWPSRKSTTSPVAGCCEENRGKHSCRFMSDRGPTLMSWSCLNRVDLSLYTSYISIHSMLQMTWLKRKESMLYSSSILSSLKTKFMPFDLTFVLGCCWTTREWGLNS